MRGEREAGVGNLPFAVLIAGGGTGGHLFPALVLAEAIRKRHPAWRVVLAGARRGLEASVLPTREFPFHLLAAEPIYRRQWWKNLRWPFQAIRLIGQVDALLQSERPGLVIGTGGYVAGPVLWLAARRGLPTAVLELNAVPGLAVRWLAGTVREIWLGSPEARARLKPGPRTQVLDTGTPITPPDPELRPKAQAEMGLDPGRPVVLVTGGSQGALPLNQAMAEWIEAGFPNNLQLLWITGRGTYHRFSRFHRPPAVQVHPFLDPIGPGYAVADLALSRAGMMTVAELCAWGIPSILVPLPTAAADHQRPNARAMEQSGAAIHLPQSELTGEKLAATVFGVIHDRARLAAMRQAALGRAKPEAISAILTRIGVLSG